MILLLTLPLLAFLVVASRRWIWLKASLLSLLLVLLSLWWLIDRLSGDGLNAATLYHLRTSMEGAGVAGFAPVIAATICMLLASLLPLGLPKLRRLHRNGPGVALFCGFAAVYVATVMISPLRADAQRLVQHMRPVDPSPVAAEYLLPDRPLADRRNIVWIYAESLERTYLDEEVFPGLLPNLGRLAGEGLDFRDIASPEGSGWTIAGMVASMCGVPLTAAREDENSFGRMASFLPNALCLGDYLKDQGYTTEFLGGASAEFAGKGNFLASHGFDVVMDRRHFEDKGVPRRHFSNWGVHDDVLLDEAFDRFMALSSAGAPFLLTALTMDTHHPAGHLPVSCRDVRYRSRHGNIGLLNALKCSDRLIERFVQKIRDSDYADDTLIVIASDHLAMPNHISHVIDRMHRENLLLILGRDIAPQQVARGGGTLDTGATVLNLLDPEIEAIGFGRSLVSDRVARSASVAYTDPDADYLPYLAYARTLWMGERTRELQVDEERVLVGNQQVQPPVLLEYDPQWNIKAMYLEDTSKHFALSEPENVLAYVDRCAAFDDDAPAGWCALLVNSKNQVRMYRPEQLRKGISVDTPMAGNVIASAKPSVRRSVAVSRPARRMCAGDYQLQLQAKQMPAQPFWLEAVSARDRRVLARQWIDAAHAGLPIMLALGLDRDVEDLQLRAWLNSPDELVVDDDALVAVDDTTGPGGSGHCTAA